jgi:hypothetical protein
MSFEDFLNKQYIYIIYLQINDIIYNTKYISNLLIMNY